MKVLVACERYGRVRDAFLARGHDALSCDIEETESIGPHYRGDVRDVINDGWDLMIAHTPCTYLCNSGVRWLHTDPKRWPKLFLAADFFVELWNSNIKMISMENPVMHKYAKKLIGSKQSQVIQPWQFGHGEIKATCLWNKNLPNLKPTNIVNGREARIHKMGKSKNRGELRSITYQGIADAMANQWGDMKTNPKPNKERTELR